MLDTANIPHRIGHYLAGFTDGEGSLNVSFRKRGDYAMPWKVSLCFNVSQRDKVVLILFQRYLKCGTLRQRQDGVWYYEVNNFAAIVENVIPFFERFGPFLGQEATRFPQVQGNRPALDRGGRHLTRNGIHEILTVRRDMNDGGAKRRKYSDDSIVELFGPRESSETVRRAPTNDVVEDDTVRTA